MVHGKTVVSRLTECAHKLNRFPDFKIEFDSEKSEWRVRCKAIYGAGVLWNEAERRGTDLRIAVAELADAMTAPDVFVAFRADAEWKYARWLKAPACRCEGCQTGHVGWEVVAQADLVYSEWEGLKPEWVTDPDWHTRPDRPWNREKDVVTGTTGHDRGAV